MKLKIVLLLVVCLCACNDEMFVNDLSKEGYETTLQHEKDSLVLHVLDTIYKE